MQRVEKLLNGSLEPGSRTQIPFPAVFWPWFGSVEFIFDLSTGQIATFSTGCMFSNDYGVFTAS
jgi:hypothetical protein